eukprot:scaffold421285_cov56-Attheya_sp.AAC.4
MSTPTTATAGPTDATSAGNTTAASGNPTSYVPNLAGSVIEASDGLGGKTLIRVQNMSSTDALSYRGMKSALSNIVGTADVGFPIRLEGLVYAHSTFASYEPELFPGLIYRLASPRVVFLIFVSGKIVITGAKTEVDLSEALTKIYPVLVEYRKANIAGMPGMPPQPYGATAVVTTSATSQALSVPGSAANPPLDPMGSEPTSAESVREMEEV